jgi:hypothetical protein
MSVSSEHDSTHIKDKAKALAQLFEDAAVKLTEYKESKSASSSEQFSEILKNIPQEFDELKLAVASDSSKQRGLRYIEISVLTVLSILTTLRDEADQADPPIFRARHMTRDPHLMAGGIAEELSAWTQ